MLCALCVLCEKRLLFAIGNATIDPVGAIGRSKGAGHSSIKSKNKKGAPYLLGRERPWLLSKSVVVYAPAGSALSNAVIGLPSSPEILCGLPPRSRMRVSGSTPRPL
jgi:hypothetical protein